MRIEATTNPRVKAARRLHRSRERRTTGRTLLEGPKLLEAALEAGVSPVEVFAANRSQLVERAERFGAVIHEVSRSVLESISTTVEPQDPVAVVEVPVLGVLERQRTLVLVDIGDPGNLGTLIRTAAALDWRVAVLGGADPWSPKVLRAGAGSHFAQPIIPIGSTVELETAGLATVATVAGGGARPEEIVSEDPIALLVGSEAHGLPTEIVARCAHTVTIPISGSTESLNASIAGAIAMYALSSSESRRDLS